MIRPTETKNQKPKRLVLSLVGTLIDENGSRCHPGLWLDRFARAEDQKQQYAELKYIYSLDHSDYDGIFMEAHACREKMLNALQVLKFTARNTGPFTLHLSRATALENAGICLHPVYGFAYIPGTALKGMAHAFACEVWLPVQPAEQKQEKWEQICAVFGFASSPWLTTLAGKHKVISPKAASTGAVVFHDAWPLAWPKLICDIVNNHHPDYYAGKTGKDEQPMPPGDWENPNPVYFLAVALGTEFDFPLSLRPAAALKTTRLEEKVAKDLPKLAAQWLLGALVHRGAGAKTNAGYGRFRLEKPPEGFPGLEADVNNVWHDATDVKKADAPFREQTFTLELVSPAFLAGAGQEKEDCDLRPATLRGHLRWWWRTMHAGYLDVATLKSLEAAIWGSAEDGGAVALEVLAVSRKEPVLFSKKDLANNNRLEPPPNKKTSQGLSYLAYGMDETKQQVPMQRHYVEPSVSWKVVITTRARKPEEAAKIIGAVPVGDVFKEAVHSLYLLCAFGGVGAKSRNGFGSFKSPGELSGLTVEGCFESAACLRRLLGIDNAFEDKKALSPSLKSCLYKEVAVPWGNVWCVLDKLGYAYQGFSQRFAHNEMKMALGLPRRIHGPRDDGPVKDRNGNLMQDIATWRSTRQLGERHSWLGKRKVADMRDPSPFFFHIVRNGNKKYLIRITAFPSPCLPDIESSRKMLTELLEYLEADLNKSISK